MKAQQDPPGPFPQSSPSARAPAAPAPATGALMLQDRPDAPLRRGSQSVCRHLPPCRKEPARTRFSRGTSGNPQIRERRVLPGHRHCGPYAPVAPSPPIRGAISSLLCRESPIWTVLPKLCPTEH